MVSHLGHHIQKKKGQFKYCATFNLKESINYPSTMMSQIQCTIIEVKGWQQEDWPKSPAEEAIKTAEKCPIKNYPLLHNCDLLLLSSI